MREMGEMEVDEACAGGGSRAASGAGGERREMSTRGKRMDHEMEVRSEGGDADEDDEDDGDEDDAKGDDDGEDCR